MEPCGAPCSMFAQFQNVLFIYIFCFRWLKLSLKYSVEVLLNLEAWRFTIKRECGKQANAFDKYVSKALQTPNTILFYTFSPLFSHIL